jgi:hypothetical protein
MSDNDVPRTDGHLDGNALAGPMSAIFAGDLTTATVECAGCGLTEPVGAVPVYGSPMGLVARCPGCDLVLFSYTELAVGRTLEMRGAAALRLPPV